MALTCFHEAPGASVSLLPAARSISIESKMTYLRFHLIFNLPLLIVLAALTGPVPWTTEEAEAFGLVLLAVMIFTTPWDNLAAKWGIWGFPREKYSLRIGYLPVEEYAFFLLQSANVMLALRALLHFFPDWQTGQETEIGTWTLVCLAASVIPWIFIAMNLVWLRRKVGPRVNYANHLAWFLPMIYAQWILAPPLFLGHAGLLALVTGRIWRLLHAGRFGRRSCGHLVLRREANHRREVGRRAAVGRNRFLFPDLAPRGTELPVAAAGGVAVNIL